ncbi:MAG: hypothetical protein LBV58_01925 [Acholeplasmatales bacterium]|jgi:hypothetical protein|nr:hypothetical protein [Acholeplasmatales bacterium]
MKKKLLILILSLPLIFLFTITSVSNIAGIIIDTPISSIKLDIKDSNNYKKMHSFDLGDLFQKDIFLELEVAPTSVKKENINPSFSFHNYNELDMSDSTNVIKIEELKSSSDTKRVYKLTPISPGVIYIEVSVQSFKERVLVEVFSSFPLQIDSINLFDLNDQELKFSNLKMGDVFFIKVNTTPTNTRGNFLFESSNQNILKVDENSGKSRALSNGVVEVKITLLNGIKTIKKEFSLTIHGNQSLSGIVLEGLENIQVPLLMGKKDFKLTGFVDESINLDLNEPIIMKDNVWVESYLINILSLSLLESGKRRIYFDLIVILKDNINDNFTIMFRLNNSLLDEDILFSSINISYKTFDSLDLYIKGEMIVSLSKNAYLYTLESHSESLLLDLIYIFDFPSLYTLEVGSNKYMFIREGTFIAYAYIYSFNSFSELEELGVLQFEITVLNPYPNLLFIENSFSLGIESLMAFAKYRYVDGLKCEVYYYLDGSLYNNNYLVDFDKITFSVSDTGIGEIRESGNNIYLKVNGTGLLEVKAYDKDSILLGNPISASFKIRLVDGINVYSEKDLLKASNLGEKLVIQENIYLGESYFDYNEESLIKYSITNDNASKLRDSYKNNIITETADQTFYKNTSREAILHYLVEFKNDVFGNGKKINTHFISYLLNRLNVQNSLFKGPLDMVALGSLVAVKAEDNMSFLVRTEGVILDNLELYSYDIEKNSLPTFDINELNYVGTTLSIMEDKVYLVNSRVGFGRTVLRIFGEEREHYYTESFHTNSDLDSMIEVNLISNVLSNSREFIVKVGANAYKIGEVDKDSSLDNKFIEASPYLLDENSMPYLNNNQPFNVQNLRDDYFVDKYMKTKVIFTDNVFMSSGLFCIGVESKFSGPFLDGHRIQNIYEMEMLPWNNIAGTSYAALLTFNGSNKFYDFKPIELIDSRTLIEIFPGVTDPKIFEYFKFDIKQLLLDIYMFREDEIRYQMSSESIKIKLSEFEKILIYDNVQKTFITHGGIVFYGGGKNYSVIEINDTQLGSDLKRFNISLEDLSSITTSTSSLYANLLYAAGKEDFNFLMYSSESSINYELQKYLINNGLIEISKFELDTIF